MDKRTAKEILARARPWSRQFEDDEREASRMAAEDPALSKTASDCASFNTRVHSELANLPVPADLREQILTRSKIRRVSAWRTPARFLAMAAAFTIFLLGLFYWADSSEDTSIAGFRSRMVGFALREYRMDLFTRNLTDLKQFLAAKGGPSDFQLPPRLSQTPVKGGAKLTWQNKPVSMVCFEGRTNTIYMFVIAENNTGGAPSENAAFAKVKGLPTATWSAAGKTFLLAGRVGETELEGLIRP